MGQGKFLRVTMRGKEKGGAISAGNESGGGEASALSPFRSWDELKYAKKYFARRRHSYIMRMR